MKNMKLGAGSPMVSVKNQVYSMSTMDGEEAEITMYGDIYEEQPRNWWGDPIEGQFITVDMFLEDLKKVEGCRRIHIHMHSYGGESGAALLIHNRLRDMAAAGTDLICTVDGVAMSGGSLIMCACQEVRVHPGSIIMIHNCWSFLYGGYNAAELREQASGMDAWDQAMVEIYTRKSGQSAAVVKHMMEETRHLTGREAKEKGLADVLLDESTPALSASASKDGRTIYVGGHQMHLCPGMYAPDCIPTAAEEPLEKVTPGEPPAMINTHEPEETGEKEGGTTMANTVEELRQECPELVSQIEEASAQSAANEERTRIQGIDEIAGLFDADLVREAKYGNHPCSAQELSFRAAQAAAQAGQSFIANAQAQTTQAAGVGGVPAAEDVKPKTEEGKLAQARASVKELFGEEE